MKTFTSALGLTLLSLATSPAGAELYSLTVSGAVSSYTARDQNLSLIDLPSLVAVGDVFSMSAIIDTTKLTLNPQVPADSTWNVYMGFVDGGLFQIGSFNYKTTVPGGDFGRIELWDNRFAFVNPPGVDAFSIAISHTPIGEPVPVNLGPELVVFSFSLLARDLTGSARTSDLIDELPPLDLFGTRNATITLRNVKTLTHVNYGVSNIQASLTPLNAVPEPSSWALLAAGFACVGGAMRRRTASQRRPFNGSGPAPSM